MGYGVTVEVWGDYALFSRPEMKVERVSYDVMTPSAARGIMEAIYWKRAIRYVIDKIHVYREPVFTNIRRNEVSAKILGSDMKQLMQGKKNKGYLNTAESIQQRASMMLRDVHYAIECHFEMTDSHREKEDENEKKHYNILLRRLRKGQCYHQPYFGCREFPASFRIIEGEAPKSTLIGERNLGFMLYDMDYSDPQNITPSFFRAQLQDGVMDLRNIEIVR